MVKRLGKTAITEFNDAYNKTLAWFFSFPEQKFSLNDLVSEIGLSKTTASRIVTRLIDEGFLSTERVGRAWQIHCNRNHHYNYGRKVGYNLMMISESPVMRAVHEAVPYAKAVVLFGSYRRGDDNEKSDVDIAAEVPGCAPMKVIELGTMQKFGFRENVPVNLHVFSRKNVDINLFSNIANGIVLEGFLEARP